MKSKLFILFCSLSLLSVFTSSDARSFAPSRKQQINKLPGYNGSSFASRHWTGYIPVHHGKHQMFYWLIESEVNVETDPVILWLTGGPGCSTMDSLIYEHGPFIFSLSGSSDVQLSDNPYSWTKTATMIYVDSPVGVGLSYSTTGKDIVTDDEKTTDDLVDFITKLLQKEFPQLLKNPLYIAGESYGGVFVPMLASKLLKYNEDAQHEDKLNLQGYAVGNGVTDDVFDGNAQPEFAYGMGLIDPPTYEQLKTSCQGSFWNATPGGHCATQLRDAYDRFYWLNPYDILQDCFIPDTPSTTRQRISHTSTGSSGSRKLRAHASTSAAPYQMKYAAVHQDRQDSNHPQQKQRTSVIPTRWPIKAVTSSSGDASPVHWPLSGVRSAAAHTPTGSLKTWHGRLGHSVPCSDRRVALVYMNRDDVREALHAPSVQDTPWQPCSDIIEYDFVPISMIPYHQAALRAGLKVLVYSGDHDFVVPFTGTRDWVYSLEDAVTRPYAPWTIDGQVAGFLVEFQSGLQFVTVKGAGHMVPQTNPSQALHLITRFLFDNL